MGLFTIRNVTTEDLPDLYPLYHRCLSNISGHCIIFQGQEMRPASDHYLDIQLKHGHFKVAEEESSGVVVGFGGLLRGEFAASAYKEILDKYGALIPPQGLQHMSEYEDTFFQKVFSHKPREGTEVKSVAVDEDHRGKGIGRLLLDSLVQEARTLGERELSGVTSTQAMKRAFETAGFYLENSISSHDDPSFIYSYLDKSRIGFQYADNLYRYTLKLVD